MSGAYIFKAVPLDANNPSIAKIGFTRGSIEKRAYDSFLKEFDTKEYLFKLIEYYPSNQSIANNIQNLLIGILKCEFKFEGFNELREFFVIPKEKEDHFSKFVKESHSRVLDSYSHRPHILHHGMPESMGSIICSRRKEMGITQEKLASLSGLRQKDISRIENGGLKKLKTLNDLIPFLNLNFVLLRDEDI